MKGTIARDSGVEIGDARALVKALDLVLDGGEPADLGRLRALEAQHLERADQAVEREPRVLADIEELVEILPGFADDDQIAMAERVGRLERRTLVEERRRLPSGQQPDLRVVALGVLQHAARRRLERRDEPQRRPPPK